MARSGIMLAYPFEQERLAKWKPPYIVQPKLDGERCRAIRDTDTGEFILLSSEQNVITSVPHIVKYLNDNFKYTDNLPELDGELYLHGLPFEEIHSIVGRTVNINPDFASIQYHIFDLVMGAPQFVRSQRLIDILSGHTTNEKGLLGSPLVKVSNYICETFDKVIEIYDFFIDIGYEGMIVRNFEAPYIRKRSTNMMKFKPKKKDIYKIIGYKEEVAIDGTPKNRLGALICKPIDGTVEDRFAVGTGFTAYDREELWKLREILAGKLVEVSYQHITTGRKVPRFPVFSTILD